MERSHKPLTSSRCWAAAERHGRIPVLPTACRSAPRSSIFLSPLFEPTWPNRPQAPGPRGYPA